MKACPQRPVAERPVLHLALALGLAATAAAVLHAAELKEETLAAWQR